LPIYCFSRVSLSNMECDRPDQSAILRQGDIFAAHPGTTNWENPWQRFGVVLSADCDIAHQKIGSRLAFAPIVGLPTYLADVWLPAQAITLGEECEGRLGKSLAEFHGDRITTRHVLKWSNDEVIAALHKAPTAQGDGDRDKSLNQIIRLKEALIELRATTSGNIPTDLNGLRNILNSFFQKYELIKKDGKHSISLRQQLIRTALNSLGDEARFDTCTLSDLWGMEPEMREHENCGFVIDLRRLSIIQFDNVYLQRSQWFKEPLGYLRICRLRGVYKSDLMYKFSNLFVRVGLEDSRRDVHNQIFSHVINRLVPEG
jgi:hypothetical protein